MEQQGVSQCIHKQVETCNTHACHSVRCVVGKDCGIYIWHVQWGDVYSVKCGVWSVECGVLGMYDCGVCIVWKVYSAGYVRLDSSVSNVRAQWEGEEEGYMYSVGSTAYQLVLGSMPAL